MAPQEVRAHCDLVTQAATTKKDFWPPLKSQISRGQCLFHVSGLPVGGRGKSYPDFKDWRRGPETLAMSVYLEFKKQILPHHYHLTLP